MNKIDRRSALGIGLAAASAAMMKPAAAQTTGYKDATPWPGVVVRAYDGETPSIIPGFKTNPPSSSSTGYMDNPDPDTDTEDADTSTDAETDAGSETDEEPTIRAPHTVAGSVGSGASVGGGSVWGDDTDEANESSIPRFANEQYVS